jgi:hypothetical protein
MSREVLNDSASGRGELGSRFSVNSAVSLDQVGSDSDSAQAAASVLEEQEISMLEKALIFQAALGEVFESHPNACVVYVWDNEGSSQKKRPGHVSIQTAKHYMSLWPGGLTRELEELRAKKGPHSKGEAFVAGRGRLHPAHLDAVKAESWQDAKYKFVFYGLDAPKINKKFRGWEECEVGWKLYSADGKGYVRLNHTDNQVVHNCSSFVLDLLREGGIERLISRRVATQFCTDKSGECTSVSPRAVWHLVEHAKLKEKRLWDTKEHGPYPGPLGGETSGLSTGRAKTAKAGGGAAATSIFREKAASEGEGPESGSTRRSRKCIVL